MNRPEIVCLCCSYRFKDDILSVYRQLTDEGYIVLLPAWICEQHDKEWYMALHKEKIKMSDVVVIIRGNEYVGESVQEEINYAVSQGKPICYAIALDINTYMLANISNKEETK